MSTNAKTEALALALKLEAAIQMRDHARSERDELRAEVEQLRAALEQKAAEPCIFEGEIPCPQEWPDDRVQWCAPCFARESLEAVRG